MNPVLFWNSILLEASRRDFTSGHGNGQPQQPGPTATSRAMAIVHLAIHDAVAFRRRPGAAYLNKKNIPHNIATPLTGDVEDIIAGAAVTTLKALYPKFGAYIDDAVGQVDAAAFAEGVAVGQAMLDARANDGSDQMIFGPQPTSPAYGEHRADPFAHSQGQLGPVWGNVKRFLDPNHKPLDAFPGEANFPNFLDDADFRADYDEVRTKGSVVRNGRTSEQERIGVYWGYDGANNLGVPPRLYNQVARKIVEAQSPPLGLGRMAELFASLNVAMADGGIDAWHYKYKYDLWRPVVAIRSENDPADMDCFWAPLGMPQTNGKHGTLTPNFPAYPSGHATFGAALMQTLRLGLGTAPAITLPEVLAFNNGGGPAIPEETFSFVSDELDGVASDPDGSIRPKHEKTFRSFAEPVWENSVSRIYLGVHWRFDGIPSQPTQNVGGVPRGLAVGPEAHDFFNTAPSLGGLVQAS
jgi:hypothetical protein